MKKLVEEMNREELIDEIDDLEAMNRLAAAGNRALSVKVDRLKKLSRSRLTRMKLTQTKLNLALDRLCELDMAFDSNELFSKQTSE